MVFIFAVDSILLTRDVCSVNSLLIDASIHSFNMHHIIIIDYVLAIRYVKLVTQATSRVNKI